MLANSKAFAEWFQRKWQNWTGEEAEAELRKHYLVTFSTYSGRVVLQHLMDTQYCVVYEGTDPIALASFNARRSVIQDILINMDLAENPSKYRMKVEMETKDVRLG